MLGNCFLTLIFIEVSNSYESFHMEELPSHILLCPSQMAKDLKEKMLTIALVLILR